MTKQNIRRNPHLTAEEILDLVHGEASETLRQWWETHRQQCPDCAESVQMAKAVEEREAQMPLEPLPLEVENRMLDRITAAIGVKQVSADLLEKLIAKFVKPTLEWKVRSYMPALTFRGPDDEKDDKAPFRIADDENGGCSLSIDLGVGFARRTVCVMTADDREVATATLNGEGATAIALPAGTTAPIKLWLVKKQ